MRRPGWLVGLVLVVGLAGAVLSLIAREADTQFVVRQNSLAVVGAATLDRLVATTDDPRPLHHGRALRARCTSSVSGARGNPWICVVRYPRLPRIDYRVTVYANRSIHGVGRPEGAVGYQTPLTVSGCCVGAP